ncbi:MAG: Rep protein, partial [uncultured bacterium]
MSHIVEQGENAFYLSNRKIKICGKTIDWFKYGREFFVGGYPKTYREKITEDEPVVCSDEEILRRNKNRARKNLIDYVNCNSSEWIRDDGWPFKPIFITLTFADNIQDITWANREFSKFIQRFNTMVYGRQKTYLRYLGVIEFQKRGAIHYHIMFFNLPFIENIKEKLTNIWQFGFFDVKALDRVKSTAKYMGKYFYKSFDNRNEKNKKSYFISRGLKKPRVVYFEELVDRVLDMLPLDSMEVYKADVPVDYMISMDYRQYNLKNFPDVFKEVIDFIDKYLYDINNGDFPPPEPEKIYSLPDF